MDVDVCVCVTVTVEGLSTASNDPCLKQQVDMHSCAPKVKHLPYKNS